MRARFCIFLLLLLIIIFINFWNAHQIVGQTQELAKLEKKVAAEKNINTELLVERDDLRSGKNIASLVRVELDHFNPQEEQGKIIYVHEPVNTEDKTSYCIIDLFTTKAQAREIKIQLD
ncbi:MAG: hypothetical protein WC179_01770 [Candidatus Cloacimonadaceae bacterium]|jgi:hypothetical protein|nr:hypothetical protein [Candidatus Cloacimonadota bacterium]MDD5624662.1 hypothetical protein [Candidatus Cloacimonadota bacterium]MDY0112332.1 hypothetical protein [Candidatus Syntrophosphaera sp.]